MICLGIRVVDTIELVWENFTACARALQVRTPDLAILLGGVRKEVDSVDGETVLELFSVEAIRGLLLHELFDADMNLGSSGAGDHSRRNCLLLWLDLLDLREVAVHRSLRLRHCLSNASSSLGGPLCVCVTLLATAGQGSGLRETLGQRGWVIVTFAS